MYTITEAQTGLGHSQNQMWLVFKCLTLFPLVNTCTGIFFLLIEMPF